MFGLGIPELIIILVIIGIILLMYCCYVCSKACDEESSSYDNTYDDEYTKCYLCLSKIRQAKWDDGSHRKVCIQNNLRKVQAMPDAPFPINCPNCTQRLKQWPDRGPEVNIMTP